MRRSPLRRLPFLFLVGIYLGSLVMITRFLREESRVLQGRETYTLSRGRGRPLRVVVWRHPVEERHQKLEDIALGVAVFSGTLLVFTLLDVPGKGVVGLVIRTLLSGGITVAAFVFLGGAENPVRIRDLRDLLLGLPWMVWIPIAQIAFLVDRLRSPAVDAAMRPTDLLLTPALIGLFATGLTLVVLAMTIFATG